MTKLWRYPVKSMLGEPCASLDLTVRGVEGDRLFAIRDVDGKFGSGKSTRRFCMIDGLFEFHSTYDAELRFDVYADVLVPGSIQRGDRVAVVE